MGWLERALAILFAGFGLLFALGLAFPKFPLTEEVCPRCIYTQRTGLRPVGCRCGDCPPGCTDGTWCKTYPYNRVCPSCGYKWENTSYSIWWLPSAGILVGLIVAFAVVGGVGRTLWLRFRRPTSYRFSLR
jgi:hypothetical protein